MVQRGGPLIGSLSRVNLESVWQVVPQGPGSWEGRPVMGNSHYVLAEFPPQCVAVDIELGGLRHSRWKQPHGAAGQVHQVLPT